MYSEAGLAKNTGKVCLQAPDKLETTEEYYMKTIRTKQFQILTDINMAWDFMVEIYNLAAEKGYGSIEPPFLEYALTSMWMNKDYMYLCRFWLEKDVVIGFVFYENLTDIHFVLRPGYEDLAEEMVEYANNVFPDYNGEKQLIFSEGQTALMEAAEKRGYKLCFKDRSFVLNIAKTELNFELPDGFSFVDPAKVNPVKLARCTWKGFNEWELGPFENWEDTNDKRDWSPHKSYTDVLSGIMAPPPHATSQYDVVIANEEGEYVCYSGMWWVPENGLAYMEPLCTIPEYQHRGLAAAALTEHYRRFKEMGGKILTGGGNDFYKKIGYDVEEYSWVYKKIRN